LAAILEESAMFSGGDYEEVGRWLLNFVTSHAKRESPRLEGAVETAGPREGQSYGVRVRLDERLLPPLGAPPVELAFTEVRDKRGSLAWCQLLAGRVRALGRALLEDERRERRSA
jgi:hypothetical protein